MFLEKDEHPELIERYRVANFPAFVWTDASGDLLSRTVQPSDSAELLEELEDVLADLEAPTPRED